MFASVNEKYNALKSNERNNRFIVESVVGDDTVPFVDDEDETIVDSESVDDQVVSNVDKMLDKLVNSEDYDDDDLDELLDDEDSEGYDELDSLIDSAEIEV